MNKSKKQIGIVLVLIFILGFGSFAGGVKTKVEAWLRPELTIMLHGQKLEMTDVNGDVVNPLTYNGTTYLPVRAISENLDLQVGWDAETQTVTLKGITDNQDKIEIPEYSVSFTREKIDGGFRFTANVPDDQEYTYEWRFLSEGEELATFEKPSIPIEFKNEGNYTIELRVQNPEGHWSETYTDEFYYQVETLDSIDETGESSVTGETSYTFDNYTIRYQTDNITDDYEEKYKGDRALKFIFDEENPTAKIKLEGILLKDQGNISFQIKSSTREPIDIKYVGLVGNTEIFEKNSTYAPELENTWVMLPLTVNTSSVDDLELTFRSMHTTVWIDQIEIQNIK